MGNERLGTTIAVTDAGPVIYLSAIDALSLLSMFDEVVIPKTVQEELAVDGFPDGMESLEYTVVEGSPADLPPELDPGERAGLAIALDRSDVVFLTDDLDARTAAKDRDVEVHGTVGVIAAGFGHSRLSRDEAASLMRRLQSETNLFITDAVIERGIQRLDELAGE